jgi:4-hydroxy-tetrahydrodipicolinate synthase
VASKRIPIIAGTGTNSTDASMALSLCAEKAGADGLLLVTPYYNKPTQKGLYTHFESIASLVHIPIILYNVPSRTGVNLQPETVASLSEVPNIEGVKEASGDISQVAKIIDLCPKDFAVYAGNDDQTIPVLSLGGIGVISVTANILPEEIHTMVMEYLFDRHEEALKSFLKLRSLDQALFVETNPAPIKKAMNLLGMSVGGCRLPLVEMEVRSVSLLKQAMTEYGLFDRDL